MSDDDDYYDDDYDEDWPWLEDANLDIADELAEAAIYSPVPIEDPSLDIVESFSDWEYYSDDYYDYDPALLQRLGKTGQLQEAEYQGVQPDGPPRKKKRKLLSAGETLGPFLRASVGDLDATSFRGVVWRKHDCSDERTELYEPGDGEKVSLLKNWRELFKTSRQRKGRVWPSKEQQIVSDPNRGTSHRNAKGKNRATVVNKTRSRGSPESQSAQCSLDDSESLNRRKFDGALVSPSRMSFSPPPSSLGEWRRALMRKTTETTSQDSRRSGLGHVTSNDENSSDEIGSADSAYPKGEPETSGRNETPPPSTRNNHDSNDRDNTSFQQFLHVEIPPGSFTETSRRKKRSLSSVREPDSNPDAALEEQTTHRISKRRRVVSRETKEDGKETQGTKVPKRWPARTTGIRN